MNALLLKDTRDLEVSKLSLRELQPKEVLIKIAACGVCGTDLHLFHGEEGAGSSVLPLVMGHEFSGTVIETGESVKNLKVGDRVTVDPNVFCGECFHCRSGNGLFCENAEAYGVSMHGGFAEECIVLERAAYKIPDSLSLEHASLVEPISCCLHGIDRANINVGDVVVVIGCGSIGQLMIQLALLSGASSVIAIDPQDDKRKKSIELGASFAIDPITEDVKQVLADKNIKQVKTVIECVGNPKTMEQAVDIASRGSTVLLFGLTPPNSKMTILPLEQVFRKELIITSSFINPLVTDRAIDLLANNKINVDAIITDRVKLDNAIEVFTDDSYRKRGKILIVSN